MSKYEMDVMPGDHIEWSDKMISDDYHCECKYCNPDNFFGELFCETSGKFYSNGMKKNIFPDLKDPRYRHNNPAQISGYLAAVQKFTEPGDLVFDPCTGTGCAIIAAEQNGRRGLGIELEFAESTRYSTQGKGTVIEGNCLEVDLADHNIEEESIQLMITGSPYPVMPGASVSSDIHTSKEKGGYGDYRDKNNVGKWKHEYYKENIHSLYTRFLPYIKVGGYFMIGIKDLNHKKSVFNLHELIMDNVLEHNPELEYHGWFCHRHLNKTLHMSTYGKRYGVTVPMHQTFIIVKKIEETL